jgi:integrase
LFDTACRIGEAVSNKVDVYLTRERQILVRESKGREPRALPLSPETVAATEAWLKVRARVMAQADPAQDEGWLFLSEFGDPIETMCLLRATKCCRDFAKLPEAITLRSLAAVLAQPIGEGEPPGRVGHRRAQESEDDADLHQP